MPETLASSPFTVLVVRDLNLVDVHKLPDVRAIESRIGYHVIAAMSGDGGQSTGSAADETEGLREIVDMLGNHYPPLPLPQLDPDDPGAVRAWCRERVQELQRLALDRRSTSHKATAWAATCSPAWGNACRKSMK